MIPHDSRLRFQSILLVSMILCVLILNSCTMRENGDLLVSERFQQYTLQLNSEGDFRFARFYEPYWLSISYAPSYRFTAVPAIEPLKVKPTLTPWARAWDRGGVVRSMNEILVENGVVSKNVRVRMIAHAVVASGWKQHVWNYNAWGVKQGSWSGNWYVMPTEEINDDGEKVLIENEAWRSFDSWAEAIADFRERINVDSDRPSYREAYGHLVSERVSVEAASDYWEALGSGNYYTATKFTGRKFAGLCASVRSYLDEGNS